MRAALEREGMHVESSSDIHDILELLGKLSYDVLVMDRMLGHDDSIQILPKVRKQFPKLKILILSALGDSSQKANAINHGADDYLSKPFHVPELVARVRALARREENATQEANPLNIEGLEIILDRQEDTRCNDKLIDLHPKNLNCWPIC